jgi:hypothetical protein
MQNFIRKIFGRNEPEKEIIPFEILPAWLNTREKAAKANLISGTDDPVKKIRGATSNLQSIVATIEKAEQDPTLHPKLKSIAKNSLPLFVKAMNSSLSKELPEDIEKFYPAVVESLKNCLNSTRGQGRYLQIVFPEEMKSVRSGIDVIGREINEITAALTEYRREKTLIDTIQKIYNALIDIETDKAHADSKDQRINKRIAEISDRIAAIEKEVQTFPADQRMSEVAGLEAALRETENQRDSEARIYAALSMTASHVFRKAEKIAVRQKHTSETATLRRTMELLSDHEIPDSRELRDTLALACPIAERMISAGEIQLKNKEERAIFSNTSQFTGEICAGCADLVTRNETCKIALDNLTSHPLQIRTKSLERERSQLDTMLIKEQKTRGELEEWRHKTDEKVPLLQSELEEAMKNLAGTGVVIQINCATTPPEQGK